MSDKLILSFVWFILLLFFIIQGANAEMFVHSVKGKPTISMDNYFKGIPIELGMHIDPSIKIKADEFNYFHLHCGVKENPFKVDSSRKIIQLCKSKRKPGEPRNGVVINFPIIINIRNSKLLTLEQVEWGFHNRGKYRLTLNEFGDEEKTIVDTVIKTEIEGPYTQIYFLKKNEKKRLRAGRKYSIVVTDLLNGTSSRRDKDFSGVVQLAIDSEITGIKKELKEVTKSFDNKSLDDFFSAIYLRKQEYYADSTQLLKKTVPTMKPIYLQYVQIKNLESQNVPEIFMIEKWMTLLLSSIETDNKYMAAQTCKKIQSLYSALPVPWKNYLNKLKNRKNFNEYCNLITN